MPHSIDTSTINIIPRPVQMHRGRGEFLLDNNVVIAVEDAKIDLSPLGQYLSERITFFTGLSLSVRQASDIRADVPSVRIGIRPGGIRTENEAYTLIISRRDIVINAYNPAGLFYGIQSLLQMIEVGQTRTCSPEIPVVEIHDYPAYQWRGMHLDVSRHFFTVDFVKKFIDLMAMYKFNIFHWHLTDDQGWRVEIKKYPKLTEIGAWRVEKDGSRYGGYYKQDEIKDVVRYAARRCITIVPEIDIPGHTMAALAAYPEFSCTGGPFEVPNEWGIFDDVLCPGQDGTFSFLDDVFTEIAELFPGRVVHIGGDECPSVRWKEHDLCQSRLKDWELTDEKQLLDHFVRHVGLHLQQNSKDIIGWDEILGCDLPFRPIIMAWRGIEYGIRAAEAGHDVVMTPTSHCYFDYYQAKEGEPKAIGGYLPLEKVYAFNPTPMTISSSTAKHIIGGQGNIWTEYMPNSNHVEYMALPRMCAMAEALWSPDETRDFDNFNERLKSHYPRLDLMETWYRPPN